MEVPGSVNVMQMKVHSSKFNGHQQLLRWTNQESNGEYYYIFILYLVIIAIQYFIDLGW